MGINSFLSNKQIILSEQHCTSYLLVARTLRLEMLPSFQLVPPEVLEEIFAYLGFTDLNSVALVCTSWSRVAQTPRLWKNIKLEVRAQDFLEVLKIPRLAMVMQGGGKVLLATPDVLKTRITFSDDLAIKLHVY